MSAHGTKESFGDVDISEFIYTQPTEDTTYDGYDASIAAKADTASLATVATSGSYTDLSSKPTIPAAQVSSDWTASSGIAQILHKPSLATVATTGSYTDLTNTPAALAPLSFSNPSRSLNTSFQSSTTRNANVTYSVDISTSVSLSGGAVGTVFLEYADDTGFTTNVVEIGRYANGNTGTLVVGLVLTQTATANLGGIVPANKYIRLRTANTTGTPTFTYRSGQEVLL